MLHHLRLSTLCGAVCFAGQSVSVSGPNPVTSGFQGQLPAILFGPISGNGQSITFSTCFPVTNNAYWDSNLALFESANTASLRPCGGLSFAVLTARSVMSAPDDSQVPQRRQLGNTPVTRPGHSPTSNGCC
ncbi:hypothetical protein HaLaN_28357, partial [Haematococcus lacustris]